ncbi:MAG: 2-oxoglutarate dehydrogenase, subunit, dihydrolipoamide succinyltransferase [Verrucomicrobiales bacterium]|nr:2-oxoglutarate dehydrogenase, subunit, dihydrolipoamide succinyltransferase [Verrucomicrobiales bacterium]
MSIELKVPAVGESITEVEIGDWTKAEGDLVQKDQTLVVIETEKATVDLPAPASGKISRILKRKGEPAVVGEVIAIIEPQGSPTAQETKTAAAPEPQPAAKPKAAPVAMPAAEKAIAETGANPESIKGTGLGGRILKEDVMKATAMPQTEGGATPAPSSDRKEEVVRMSKLRRTVAERLLAAQHNAALLTTFNEIDMSGVIQLRKDYGEPFKEKYQVKLGFMSFFIKAVIEGLKQIPQLNAEIRGTDIVYKNYYDIGVAIGGGKGLVVPVIRNADRLGFAATEKVISDFGARAKDGKLTLLELEGGTFTITNGGVYGSLMSTPIVNPPQSGVLGMHSIQERPVARDGQVVIRPMMYVALTYDHRIVDGREAVTFLKRIKEMVENPTRILLEV